jgi:transcriptional regulator NrdR family protein
MKCPRCGSKSKVLNTREPSEKNRAFRRNDGLFEISDNELGKDVHYRARLYACNGCEYEFVTVETVAGDRKK